MMLPLVDQKFLSERIDNGIEIVNEINMTCLVLTGFALPRGFDAESADLLLRISPGYPDVAPDMWWFDPPIARQDGKQIPATDVVEHYLGRTWQRWSRHLSQGQWRSGLDGLENYLAIVRRELERCANEES